MLQIKAKALQSLEWLYKFLTHISCQTSITKISFISIFTLNIIFSLTGVANAFHLMRNNGVVLKMTFLLFIKLYLRLNHKQTWLTIHTLPLHKNIYVYVYIYFYNQNIFCFLTRLLWIFQFKSDFLKILWQVLFYHVYYIIQINYSRFYRNFEKNAFIFRISKWNICNKNYN